MAQTSKENLKKYFETGDKPTQTEYAELIDALRHVDEKLPIGDVESLQTSLDSKATTSALLNHINDESAHGANLSGAEIKAAYEAEADTNAFTDSEKQQVADGVTHRADAQSHVSSTDKTKWNNQLSVYTIGEVLSADMGNIFRINNGCLYQYVGDFPTGNTFTTSDLSAELAETPARWADILSTFPPVEFAKFSPRSIAPNTTRFIQLDAANIKTGTTIDLGSDITVLSYQYVSTTQMLIEIQSNGNYGSVSPKINNGKEMTMVEPFSISDGDVYIPGSIETEWMNTHNDLIYGVGSWEAQVSGAKYVGYFSEIPSDRDFVYGMRIADTTEPTAQMYFGFKTLTTSTSPNGDTGYFMRLYTSTSAFTNPGSTNWTPGGFLEIKRIAIPNTSTATLELHVNGVLERSETVNITGNWYPYFYTYTVNQITELELKIL